MGVEGLRERLDSVEESFVSGGLETGRMGIKELKFRTRERRGWGAGPGDRAGRGGGAQDLHAWGPRFSPWHMPELREALGLPLCSSPCSLKKK